MEKVDLQGIKHPGSHSTKGGKGGKGGKKGGKGGKKR